MSEKKQGTSAAMQQKMLGRYGEGHHKHNKNHFPYRKHCRTHPVDIHNHDVFVDWYVPTGEVREYNQKKLRMRQNNRGRAH